MHRDATPRWGGLAFFLGLLPTLLLTDLCITDTALLIAGAALVTVGMIDDYRHISWKLKFTALALVSSLMIFGGGTVIRSIGTYDLLGRIELGSASIPFTYFAIIGLTNAINLIDGLNGLAAGISLLGFLFMGIAAVATGQGDVAVVCFSFVGILAAFLRYNFPRARIFMGDSGSLLLGFSLAVMAIRLTQSGTSGVAPMFPVLVLLVPIFDTLRVMIVRMVNGRNPFHADRSHLHHLIVRRNIPHARAVVLLWTATFVLGGMALTMLNHTSISFLPFALLSSLLLGIFADTLVFRKRESRNSLQRRLLPETTLEDQPSLIPVFQREPEIVLRACSEESAKNN
jgi:UDP-GlcNAc:undecaprenyl-phosphate GlcNAc-1-phosphate transferase